MRRFFFVLTISLLAFPALAQDKQEPEKTLKVGLDVYAGVSDIPGQRRPTDQLWAGQTVFTPSVAYANWKGARGTSAKVALGVGEATLRRPRLFPQPVEAWARQELKGGSALTVGRFFAPFGQQEWQFEARDGAQWERGSLTMAVQSKGILYGRKTVSLTSGATLGLSAASGRGFSYGSPYRRGAALDLLVERGDWRARAESDRFFKPSDGAGSFRFDFAQLAYTKGKRVQPFLSRYDWRDSGTGGGLGSFHSEILGATWKFSPSLSLETATARADGRRVAWAQLHFAQEW